MSKQSEYGIAVFHHIGDVLASTPIAKQLKADDPGCRIVWFTSEAGEVAVRHNPYIDELVVLPGDQYQLDQEFRALADSRPWKRFFTPAAYLNYDAIPGGSIFNPKGTIFGIVKKAAKLHWTVPFVFPFRLDTEEIAAARNFLNGLPEGLKILVETDYRSEQSPWRDDWNFDLLDAFRELNPIFIFTSKDIPPFFEAFQQRYAQTFWCNLPYRLNAELFNHCDAFVGVSSGVSCLTYSDYCRTDIPRIEVTRGEHWGAAELGHHRNLYLCYSRRKYQEALESVRCILSGSDAVPIFTPRLDSSVRYLGRCPACGETGRVPVRANGICECRACGAHYSTTMSVQQGSDVAVELIGDRCITLSADELLEADLAPSRFNSAHVSGNIGTVANFQEFIEKIQWVLREGGTIDLSAFNFDGLLSRSLLTEWPWLRPESSLWYFTPRFLKEVIIQAGFVIERAETESPDESAAALLEVLPKLNKELSGAQLAQAFETVNKCGAGNIIQITGKKRGGFKGRTLPAGAAAYVPSSAHTDIDGTSDLISIVVPCFNERRHIGDLINCVVAQSYLNWELIIVNDGSTDGSAEAAESLGGRFPSGRIRVVNIEHAGSAEARDVGCALAEGEWILPLDADDRLTPSCLERMLKTAKAHPDASIVYSQHEQFGIGTKLWSPGAITAQEIIAGAPLPTTVLMKRECWYEMGGFNIGSPLAFAAYHLWLSIAERKLAAVYIDEPLVRYCIRTSGQLHHTTARQWKLARALVRTVHPSSFTFDQINEEHRIIGQAPLSFLNAVNKQIALFPGLSAPYLWRGLIREQNGLFEQALSDYDAADKRSRGDQWQAAWRKALVAAMRDVNAAQISVEERSIQTEAKKRELREQFCASRKVGNDHITPAVSAN